ncbi:MAG: hypothetical protein OEN21_12700 [Myxococcales bacterium]|nr:hypothetical protein [Myxococcales bacterium]
MGRMLRDFRRFVRAKNVKMDPCERRLFRVGAAVGAAELAFGGLADEHEECVGRPVTCP